MTNPGYYQNDDDRSRRVHELFSRIARRYDLLNDIQSLGFHRHWKQRLVECLPLRAASRVLDLACGSGDLAIRVLQTQPSARVVGGDLTLPMLRIANARARSGHPPAPFWVNLDGMKLPFRPETFDVVTIGYGLRNMPDPGGALQEVARILRAGGMAAILDFGKPAHAVARAIYYAMLSTVQPLLGWLFFRDGRTYRYILDSLVPYPAQGGVTRLLEEAGFEQITCRNFALGAMSIHVAAKRLAPH